MSRDHNDVRRALEDLAEEVGDEENPEEKVLHRIEITTDDNLRKAATEVVLTTTVHIEGHAVESYLGIESVEYVIGTGVFSELSSGLADLLGARSSTFEKKLQDAKTTAFTALKMRAVLAGANAVIGIDLDYAEFSGNRVALIVSGTLVKIVSQDSTKSD